MTRRKAAGASPQPAKRPRVEAESGGGDDDGKTEPSAPSPSLSRPRRAAAIRASSAAAALAEEDAAADAVPAPDELHEALFAPVSQAELETWQGWTDIESEPAFFNFILRALGIQDAKIHEIYGVDEASMAHLPNPLGLIFLYRFIEEDETEAYEDCPDDLWFANQTTSNACGTIAMLNIAMNCDRLHLGDHLARFKAATQDLHPALRGHLLSTDATIRSTHNSFARQVSTGRETARQETGANPGTRVDRRLDMLISDLTLKLEWEDYNKKRKASGSGRSAKKAAAKKKKAFDTDAAFHFIAYVPMGADVWELNGMQEKPFKLGTFDGDWTAMARTRIADRMQAYAQYDDTAVFSLLALCYEERRAGAEAASTADDAAEEKTKPPSGSGGAEEDADDDVSRAAARRRDYTPAVHGWLKKLAEKGVLQRLATGRSSEDEP